MPIPEPHPYFTVYAKDPAKQYIADVMEKLISRWLEDDAVRDEMHIPRKGREPDYINGRWCIKCHNSMPVEQKTVCDVCGYSNRSIGFDGLLSGIEKDSKPIYVGVKRGRR